VAAYLVGSLLLPGFITPLLAPFALIHGAKRYGRSIIAVFMVFTFIVVTILESTSILAGFPLGHYYYTSLLGPKLGLIPVFVYVSYIGLGYLAWLFSTILLGEVRRGSAILTTLAVPPVASLVMVAWDLSLDPIASTIHHAWIWTQGGPYYGVPFSNFVGWGFTVYLLFQLFALYMRRNGSEDLAQRLPATHYLQAVILYMWTGVGFVLVYLTTPVNSQITDAVGHVWQTGDIYRAAAISALSTMIPLSILAMITLYMYQRTRERLSAVTLP
jgi:uncharacterized membrane protein